MLNNDQRPGFHGALAAGEVFIRDYTASDYPDLLRLLSEVYQSNVSRADLESHYLGDNQEIILAIDGARLVGCSFLSYNTDYIRISNTVFVTYVAVDETVRHRGIGTKLFEEIETRARARSCTAIELTSADSRIAAHSFYHALSFTKKKTTVFIKELY